jgi:uncharacterized protein YdhG (YjbR/CyaY superfamily)
MAKFADMDEFYASLPADQEAAIRTLVEFVARTYPQLELVVAWNQPMFKLAGKHLIGFMPTKQHINLLTVTDTAITTLGSELNGFRHGTRSISLPFDWSIDAGFIDRVLALRADELGLSL